MCKKAGEDMDHLLLLFAVDYENETLKRYVKVVWHSILYPLYMIVHGHVYE